MEKKRKKRAQNSNECPNKACYDAATMVIAKPAYKAKKLGLKLLSGFVIFAFFPTNYTWSNNENKHKEGQMRPIK